MPGEQFLRIGQGNGVLELGVHARRLAGLDGERRLPVAKTHAHLASAHHGHQTIHQMLLANDAGAPVLAHDEKLALDFGSHAHGK